MIEEYFGLGKPPFRLSCDPQFYFDSAVHHRAMAYLKYGVEQSEGFVVITGPTGVGKTMLVHQFLQDMDGTEVNAVMLQARASLRASTLIEYILSAFRLEAAQSGPAAQQLALEDYLEDQQIEGRRVVIIIDEAHGLDVDSLKELSILTNMSRNNLPLLQIFLVGQPELRHLLSDPSLEHVRQRMIAATQMKAFSLEEVADYIDHRMELAGWRDSVSCFTPEAKSLIAKVTKGVPRKINNLCTKALLCGALERDTQIKVACVKSMLEEYRAENMDETDASNEDETVDLLVQNTQNMPVADKNAIVTKDRSSQVNNGAPGATVDSDDDPGKVIAFSGRAQPPYHQGAIEIEQSEEYGETVDMTHSNDLENNGSSHEEVRQLKSSLMSFIAETRDTLGAVEEDLRSVKAGLDILDHRRKARNALLSDRLGEVHIALQELGGATGTDG